MTFNFIKRILPSWQNALLAILSAVLLVLAFPDFEYWFLAWFALAPLMLAVEREKASAARSFVVGWIFGTVFFFGTCWWLTFAPITYAGFPAWLAYLGMLFVALSVGVFPGIFAWILSKFLRRFGPIGVLGAPVIWAITEFLRYWITGNNWNAIGYSQFGVPTISGMAASGGIYLSSAVVVLINICIGLAVFYPIGFWLRLGKRFAENAAAADAVGRPKFIGWALMEDFKEYASVLFGVFSLAFIFNTFGHMGPDREPKTEAKIRSASVVAIQPNVPMSGLDSPKLEALRQRQIDAAEAAIAKLEPGIPITVVLPESPMNFMYADDREFQKFIGEFARRNAVNILFNSAEPDPTNGKYFNSAVMVGPEGREVGQYDKIYLLPFGEAVPPPLEGIFPGFVGNFSYGREYDLLPVGNAKAGVMICFESHFGQLSRRFVADGADVLIEMTNDGYLGPTPVLRQHLANAVFRAIETNRPVLRVTNVGITAYINEKGEVLDATTPYQNDTRVWSVSKAEGPQTFYVRFGDWFAWLCAAVTMVLLLLSLRRKVVSMEAR